MVLWEGWGYGNPHSYEIGRQRAGGPIGERERTITSVVAKRRPGGAGYLSFENKFEKKFQHQLNSLIINQFYNQKNREKIWRLSELFSTFALSNKKKEHDEKDTTVWSCKYPTHQY